jgi:linoleoyl-CoA desaturase
LPENRVVFPARGEFRKLISRRVEEYFREYNLKPTGDWRLYVKTAVILTWLVGSYIALVFLANSLFTAVLAAFALAQGFILVGLNVMHDGNHGSYSANKLVNKMMGFSLDLAGGNSRIWRHKHNILHHTYTNIDGADEDLHTSGLMRLSPNQVKRPWHRYQHLYAFLLYGLLTLSWVTINDFRRLVTSRIFNYRMPQASAIDWGTTILAKGAYYGYMIVIPLFFHPALYVLIAFVGVHLIQGLTLSLVFQLAHALEENSFPNPDEETRKVEKEWAVHEVETTANFATGNWLATWYLGGLNFQIEHHLFPKVCHVHYPAISRIVRRTCEESSVPYVSYRTITSALVSHYRFLRVMARA